MPDSSPAASPGSDPTLQEGWRRPALMAKRVFDLLAGAVLLLASLPILLLAALAVRLDDGPPVLFIQQRVGRRGRSLRLYKFRTMRAHEASVEELGQVTEDHDLVTRSGRWLRRLKIDELPQLLNVVKGDLSLVGPRPTVREQVDAYTQVQSRRLLLRPGMTGWAQVNGNTTIPWSERIALDVWYVDHWTPALDLQILAKTLGVVVSGEHPNPVAIEEAKRYADRLDRSS